jgi:hypothetical protein
MPLAILRFESPAPRPERDKGSPVMTRYLRTTHIDGVFRDELDAIILSPETGFILHMMNPRLAMTASEIAADADKYESDNQEEISWGPWRLARVEGVIAILMAHDMARLA